MKSLRAKMTVLVLFLGVPLLLATFQGFLYASEQNQLQERKSLAKRSLNRFAKELRGENPRARVASLYEQRGLADLGVGVTLQDAGGETLWRSTFRAPESLDAKGVQVLLLDQGVLLCVMPESEPNTDLQRLVYLVMVATLAAYACGAWLLVGRTLKPIAQVVDTVERASDRSGASVVAPTSDAEIVNLVATLNKLIAEVRAESAERVNDYATLSHELRTPIQSLLGQLELALGEERSKAELENTLVQVQAQVLRLNSLSEAVLLLQGVSRFRTGQVPEPVSLRRAVDEALTPLEPLLELRDVKVEVSIPESISVLGSAEHLDIILRNLLHNAAKHATPASVVAVESDEHAATLTITNETPPIPTPDAPRGNGLGLRICQAVARANNWSFWTATQGDLFVAQIGFAAPD